MNFQDIDASASPEVQVNENFETIDYTSVYGKRQPVTTGLTWGYYGGRWGGFSVAAGTLALTNNAENFISVLRSTGAISVESSLGSPSTAPNWANTKLYARVYRVVTLSGVVTTVEDNRAGLYGVHGPATQNPFVGAFDITGTLAVTGTITPGQTTGIVGTTTNNSVQAGSVGEYVYAALATGSATSLANATSKTITSISLTAGDWDVEGIGMFLPAGTTNITTMQYGSSLVDNALVADDTTGALYFAGEVPGGGIFRFPIPMRRLSIAATTTVYLVLNANFSVSTMTGAGSIWARRVR